MFVPAIVVLSVVRLCVGYDDPCTPFEVCQCVMDQHGATGEAKCAPNTCRHSDAAPSTCSQIFTADCENPRESWKDCEWANFNHLNDRMGPGEDLYVSVPERPAGGPVEAEQGFQILSDLDDTIVCSGGGPAGVDERCLGTEKGGVYPGVARLYYAISTGTGNAQAVANVLPLSARPKVLKTFSDALGIENAIPGIFRTRTQQVLQPGSQWTVDFDNGFYGATGNFSDAATFLNIDQTHWDLMGYRKFLNWHAVAKDMDHPVIFFGDDGQGDLIAAQMMIKESVATQISNGVVASFIHDVRQRCTEQSCRQSWAKFGIYFFANYVEAAGIAMDLGFISAIGCKSVCQENPDFLSSNQIECPCMAPTRHRAPTRGTNKAPSGTERSSKPVKPGLSKNAIVLMAVLIPLGVIVTVIGIVVLRCYRRGDNESEDGVELPSSIDTPDVGAVADMRAAF